MKYAAAIITSTAVFAVIGLLAAWGAAEHSPMSTQTAPWVFGVLPLGGAAVGFVVGCLAAAVGYRMRDRQ